jgi:fatty acid desaturase
MDTDLPACEGVDKGTLRLLSQRSNARGLTQLGTHLVLLGATSYLVHAARGAIWLAPALVLDGIVLDFLFCALHETVHRTAFAKRGLNDGVAWLAGALLLLPPEYFRAFHFAHHRYTQDPARDPELGLPPPAKLSTYLWRATGLPNWAKRLQITLRHALTGRVTEPFIADGKRRTVVREARVLWLCYGMVLALSLYFRSGAALVYWIVPAMLGQPFLRLYLMSEHMGCELSDDMYANTRTTYTNAAVRLLAWQMPFHVEHHAFPAVPFHALARLNALVRPRIEVSARGYLALHASLIRGLRTARTPLPGEHGSPSS